MHGLLVELWKASLDNKNAFATLLTDLSKAFDFVNHELFTAKRLPYDLEFTSLKLIHCYLNKQKRKVRINISFSTVLESEHGVPQGSVVGPPFLNVNICYLCYFIVACEAVKYTDDTAPYRRDMVMADVTSSFEACSKILFKWFDDN